MATFTINRGLSEVCKCSLKYGAQTELGDSGIELPMFHELEPVSFVVKAPDEAAIYRITIGDQVISDILGSEERERPREFAGMLFWETYPYFESGYGRTSVKIHAKYGNVPNSEYRQLASCEVYITPSKLSDQRYRRMSAELEAISRELLVDLFGKSNRSTDIKYSKDKSNQTTKEEEVRRVKRVVSIIEPFIKQIGKSPAYKIGKQKVISSYWGDEKLSHDTIKGLMYRAMDYRTGSRPLRILRDREYEHYDVPEHKITAAFLERLRMRIIFCRDAAVIQMKSLEADRQYRDIPFQDRGSIYEMEDVPRIKRLKSVIRNAESIRLRIENILNAHPLRGVTPGRSALKDGIFQRNNLYRHLFSSMLQYASTNTLSKPGASVNYMAKMTSRMYEQWCFIKIVDAFRNEGLSYESWDRKMYEQARMMYQNDLPRGLEFASVYRKKWKVRIRYEPWILNEADATSMGETLFRAGRNTAWSPDIVIEFQKYIHNSWIPAYVIVLDAKYSRELRTGHWDSTTKYTEIRCLNTRRQVVKQLWLIAPLDENLIVSRDSAVNFTEYGPSVASTELIYFGMSLLPSTEESISSSEDDRDVLRRFVSGTLRYLDFID